ncbi:MAG: FAD-dependent oxidoreductase [Deltaproteobacteria bacterium]|nr:FAD-dependent oxidoreductase [Deltaproteobacteria bacterium]
MDLDRLFSPLSIGELQVPNRIVMPPMATNYASPEGFPTDRQIAYYVERARGGVGYLTVEHTGILQQGKASPNMLLISTDEHASRIQRLVEAVHQAGGRILVQINHAGRQTSSAVTGRPIVGPSPVPCPTRKEVPRELSRAEIEEIVEAFSAAAERVKMAGADGVELHMAHGYLICSFLSPFSNRREDEYGGDIDGRARFALEVLRSVRSRVGPEFSISCRLSGDEYVDGGLTLRDTRQIAGMLEREGADLLHVSACNAASGYLNHPPYYVEEGVFVHLAQAVKSEVKIPVITAGRIRNPVMADRIVREEKADLVSMGRALIADPHMPEKAQQGRFEEIIPCISCNRCIQTLRKGEVRCTVNPETGNEERFRLSKTARPKTVWVVGGGPGGLKAAEAAASRGHRVTLFERNHTLGGRMRTAAVPPKKSILNDFLDFLEGRVKRLGVALELGREFTEDRLTPAGPDVVIVATGAVPRFPNWKGIEESGALSVEAVLGGEAETGGRVLVVGGGGVGAETADFLSETGREVTLVEMLDEIASDLVTHLKHYLSERLTRKGVIILTSTKVTELGRGYAVVEDCRGARRIGGFDSIVLAVGSSPDDRLAKSLETMVPELHVIGDALEPREALEALYEGEEIGMQI